MVSKQRVLGYCAVYLAAIWLIAVLPFLCILIEYRGVTACPNASLGWFLATLYGSFFIYPIAVGGLSMAALVLPLATAISLARASRKLYLFAGFYFLTTAIIALLEFVASPDAPFQIAPAAIAARPQFLDGLKTACSGGTFADYARQLPALIAAGRSYTGLLYYPGFIAQTLMQNALFIVFLAFLYYPKTEIVKRAAYLPNAIFYVLGYAMFLGSIWCLFRLSYRHDTMHLLNMQNSFIGDYAVVGLYAIALAIFVAYFQFNLEQLAKNISQLGQLLVFAGGVAFVQFDQADRVFGAQASVTNILALFLLFIFISALTLAFLLRPAKRRAR